MTTVDERVDNYIAHIRNRGLLRTRSVSHLKHPIQLCFDSNDYLSLTTDRRLSKAYVEGFEQFAHGSGASMLLSGYHPIHCELESAFSAFLSVDACVLFPSGYAANLAVCRLLGQTKARCLIDKSIHASVYDGLSLANVEFERFRHNDMTHCEFKLNSSKDFHALLTEGLFSMTGQIPSLAAMAELCSHNNCALLVDEAHAFGVIGPSGRGSVALNQLTQKEVPLRVIPLGKAFAAQGAIVAGDAKWIDALIQAGRSLIYTTAPSPALGYGLLKTLEVVAASDDRRSHLNTLVSYFQERASGSLLKFIESNTPIQHLILGCPHKTLHFTQCLQEQGIYCSAIRVPTVSQSKTGLRISLNYNHTFDDIDKLFHELEIIND